MDQCRPRLNPVEGATKCIVGVCKELKKSGSLSMYAPCAEDGLICFCCRVRRNMPTGPLNRCKNGCVLRCSEAAYPCVLFADGEMPAA